MIAAASTKEEVIKAYELRLESAREIETSVKALIKRGEKTELDALDARYLVLKAEGELAKAKADDWH